AGRDGSPPSQCPVRRRRERTGLAGGPGPAARTPRAGAPGAVSQPDPDGRGPGAVRLVRPEGHCAGPPADARRPSTSLPGRPAVGTAQPGGLVAHAAPPIPLIG